jgi:hypothetical protein
MKATLKDPLLGGVGVGFFDILHPPRPHHKPPLQTDSSLKLPTGQFLYGRLPSKRELLLCHHPVRPLYPFNVCSQRIETCVDFLIAPVDLFNIMDYAFTFCR